MKKALILLFGIQVLLGNICLMGVSYAASDDMHEHTQSECMALMCMSDETDVRENHTVPVSCTDGHCVMSQRTEYSAQEKKQMELPDMPVLVSSMITQALLVSGPPHLQYSEQQRPRLLPVLTVVLRQ